MIDFLTNHRRKVFIIAIIALLYAFWQREINWQVMLSPSKLIIEVVVILVVSLWIIWVVPKLQVTRLSASKPPIHKESAKNPDSSTTAISRSVTTESEKQAAIKSNPNPLKPNELFMLENEARKTLAQIVGGVVVILGLVFTGTNLWITQREAERNRALALEGQVTDRYTKAITQLGDKQLQVQLGGIYALERIAKDSPKDHWTIMEVLTAYVRAKAPRKDNGGLIDSDSKGEYADQLETDIQAVLTIIGRRTASFENGEVNRLNLRNVRLQNARLQKANLAGADLIGADLREAYLTEASLRRAELGGAELPEAYLTKADLAGADLRGTDLSESHDLTWEQVDSAIIDELTKLPPEFESKKQEKLKRQREQKLLKPDSSSKE